jgi:hypothetical protein
MQLGSGLDGLPRCGVRVRASCRSNYVPDVARCPRPSGCLPDDVSSPRGRRARRSSHLELPNAGVDAHAVISFPAPQLPGSNGTWSNRPLSYSYQWENDQRQDALGDRVRVVRLGAGHRVSTRRRLVRRWSCRNICRGRAAIVGSSRPKAPTLAARVEIDRQTIVNLSASNHHGLNRIATIHSQGRSMRLGTRYWLGFVMGVAGLVLGFVLRDTQIVVIWGGCTLCSVFRLSRVGERLGIAGQHKNPSSARCLRCWTNRLGAHLATGSLWRVCPHAGRRGRSQ